jgi:hypothetical protein
MLSHFLAKLSVPVIVSTLPVANGSHIEKIRAILLSVCLMKMLKCNLSLTWSFSKFISSWFLCSVNFLRFMHVCSFYSDLILEFWIAFRETRRVFCFSRWICSQTEHLYRYFGRTSNDLIHFNECRKKIFNIKLFSIKEPERISMCFSIYKYIFVLLLIYDGFNGTIFNTIWVLSEL